MNLKLAIQIMIGLFSTLSIFHILILTSIIPYEITWGGRLENDAQMYLFEGISLVINLFLVGLMLIKGGYLKPIIPHKIVNAILWVFVVFFGLNTIGNLMAQTEFEKYFAALTFFFSIFLWFILKEDKKHTKRKAKVSRENAS